VGLEADIEEDEVRKAINNMPKLSAPDQMTLLEIFTSSAVRPSKDMYYRLFVSYHGYGENI
jgi:hypothetical protein